jgi:hypothetical protein
MQAKDWPDPDHPKTTKLNGKNGAGTNVQFSEEK